MSRSRRRGPPNIFVTMDDFIAAVPWGEHRRVLVFHREHGGRTYVRLRTWNQHRNRGWWYPTKRFFVIPVDSADALAEAIRAGARGRPLDDKPSWYAAREKADQGRYEELLDDNAPPEVLERARRRIGQAR